MRISKLNTIVLFLLLLILNLILRYPMTPHEIGWDSFVIHDLINAINREGRVTWYLHPLSLFGMYAYSYAAAIPLLLSAIAQLTGVTTEDAIFIFCIFEGILTLFLGFILGGEFHKSNLFKLMLGAAISLAPGMLYWTTFTLSTRGPFIVILPLFLFLLFRTLKRDSMKYIILCALTGLVLALTHNMFILLFPLLFAFFVGLGSNRFASQLPKVNKWTFIVILGTISFLFLLPYSGLITDILTEYLPGSMRKSGLTEFLGTAVSVARHYGVLAIFSLVGIIFISMKNRFSVPNRFLLVSLALFAPVLYISGYVITTFLPVIMIFACEGLMKLYTTVRKPGIKIASLAVVFIVTISFSGVFQVTRPNIGGTITGSEVKTTDSFSVIYCNEATYNTGIYTKYEITNSSITVNPSTNLYRIRAYSEKPSLPCHAMTMLSYGVYTEEYARNNTKSLSLGDPGFWQGNLYMETPNANPEYLNTWAQLRPLKGNAHLDRAVNEFDVRYMLIENNGPVTTVLGKDVMAKRYKTFDNGDYSMYWIL
ncbi:MAG: hypothetical protein QXT63_00660 [Thermoplasmata archaeon]